MAVPRHARQLDHQRRRPRTYARGPPTGGRARGDHGRRAERVTGSSRPFTVENWLAKGRLGLPTTESAFRRHVLGAFDCLAPTVPHEEAWQDESWRYEKGAVLVVPLCVPTAPAEPRTRDGDWMQSAAGVRVRADLLDACRESLVSVVSHLAGKCDL